MPPVGLLAIAALGLVLLYALPDRIRETGQYEVVRTEDRYHADMEVVRSSAARVDRAPERPAQRRKALAPRQAKASIKALGGSVMSRPAAPLDRAATLAQRQLVAMRRDYARVRARRQAQARRRTTVGILFLFLASAAWGFVASSAWPLWSAVAATTACGGVVVAGRRAVRAQKKADARLVPVAEEVETAAAATAALQRVAKERAAGHEIRPSNDETQAIEIVTHGPAVPQAVPAPGVVSVPDATPAPSVVPPEKAEEDPGWKPGMLPIPTYTLKPAAKVRTPRPISEEDLAAGERAAKRAAEARDADMGVPAQEPEASTQTLEDILQRRRRVSA